MNDVAVINRTSDQATRAKISRQKAKGGGGIVSVIAHRGTGFPCFDVSSSINHTHQSMSKIKQKRGENKVSHRPYLLAFDTAHDVRVE